MGMKSAMKGMIDSFLGFDSVLPGLIARLVGFLNVEFRALNACKYFSHRIFS
jgi:hypothetical protein